ncbi:phosphatidylinositol-glycan biosynthesis class S protein [Spinellus fusiger]|nr:phosphatidylinositol-glycan biosynthesis class S protein [Spinellus fusiger]
MSQKQLDATTRIVVAAFWCVVLFGVPFWWKTTEVYRASLPLTEIDIWKTWQNHQLSLPTHFILHIPSPWKFDSLEIHQHLESVRRDLSTALDNSPCIHFPIVLTAEPWEALAVGQDIESLLAHKGDVSIGTYHLYIAPAHLTAPYKYNVTLGIHRNHIIQMDKIAPNTISNALRTLLPLVFLRDQQNLSQIACHGVESNKHDMNSMRTLKYSPRYQVTFSLMNNNPRGIAVNWDIRDAMKSYIYPFLDQLSIISNFTVDSQVQHYASLSMKPQFMARVEKPDYYYFEPEHLPHFINSAEWNLASTISSYPTINFILYVPSPDEMPLRIHDTHGEPLMSNAFLVPQWGGVAIKNPPKKTLASQQYHLTKKDLQPMMRIFVAQLRSLLGIADMDSKTQHMPPFMNATFLVSPMTGITTLEKDQLIRHRTVENMANAIATLHSLKQLVTEIPKMVVLDHIADKVQQSLAALQSACESINQGHYTPALQYSIEAIELSEKAFFDPTMVSMLYFPDEHKYAIYMPLFIPISVPLVMTLLKELKKITRKRKEGEPKAD